MEQLQIVICDDDKEGQANLTSILDNSDIPLTYTLFNSGEDLLKTYKVHDYDLILMDIYMDGITGIETVKKIREIDQDVFVAFITSSPDCALQSLDFDIINYITKPINVEKIFKCLESVKTQKYNAPKLCIKINGKVVSVPFRDVMYIEQKAHRIFVFCDGSASLHAIYKLDKLEQQLNQIDFFRCHTSFLVNLRWVKRIDKERMAFVMKNGSLAYIRRNDIGKAQKAFHRYGISRQIKRENSIL